MKILKAGKEISNTQTVKCWKCRAKLEIEAGDLYDDAEYPPVSEEPTEEELKAISSIKTEYVYECPCCHRINEIRKLNENLQFALGLTK